MGIDKKEYRVEQSEPIDPNQPGQLFIKAYIDEYEECHLNYERKNLMGRPLSNLTHLICKILSELAISSFGDKENRIGSISVAAQITSTGKAQVTYVDSDKTTVSGLMKSRLLHYIIYKISEYGFMGSEYGFMGKSKKGKRKT